MDEPLFIVLKLASVGALIFANAFFVAAEIGLISVRRTRVEQLATEGDSAARVVQTLLRDPTGFIATVQVAITGAGLGLGWIAEPTLESMIAPIFAGIAIPGLSSVVTFLIITYLVILLGELLPKAIALRYTERIALAVGLPTLIFGNIFRPFVWLLNHSAATILRLFHLQLPTDAQMGHTIEELKMLVSASTESGELEQHEEKMLHNVFEFEDRLVRELMIPRNEMTAVEENTTIAEFLQTFSEVRHARYPIYAQTSDNITGFIAIKDVLRAIASQGARALDAAVRAHVRPALYVPESKRVGRLFAEMQSQKIHIAIVIDEFGGTAGMVTLEDLVERIVGRLSDEVAQEDPLVETIDEHTMQVDAQMQVEEMNEQLGIHLPESDGYETVAGFVLHTLRHIPKEGEQFKFENLKLTITGMSGPKIEKVLITRL
ncbi:MAG: HlyC/CorC family transporter [Chloroflexi bacterium]|nr:HlyC/CorC family transporter [Chloroflexota bacterium]